MHLSKVVSAVVMWGVVGVSATESTTPSPSPVPSTSAGLSMSLVSPTLLEILNSLDLSTSLEISTSSASCGPPMTVIVPTLVPTTVFKAAPTVFVPTTVSTTVYAATTTVFVPPDVTTVVETKFVTQTSMIYVTLELASTQSAASVDLEDFSKYLGPQPVNPSASSDTSTDVTGTTTIFTTRTNTNVVQVTRVSRTLSMAEYATSVTSDLVLSTTAVDAAPVTTEASQKPTSDGTTTTTVNSTVVITSTVDEFRNSSRTTARSFMGIGTSGWNATATTLQTANAGPTGSSGIASGTRGGQAGVVPAVPQGPPNGYTYAASAPSAQGTWKKAKRQIGSVVSATINGVIVSWTNVYDGGAPATPTPDSYSNDAAPIFSDPSTTDSGFQRSYQAASTIVTSSQTSAAPEQTNTQTATPTTLVVSVQPASPTTTASETVAYSSSTSSISSLNVPPAPTSTNCGEIGNFSLNFDDLPAFSTRNNDTASFPPIFNPYHHLFFSGGYAYAPPPTDPFQPASLPHLTVFAANLTGVPLVDTGSPDLEDDIIGAFGAGPRARNSAYWIDAYGASMGCDNRGPEECVVTFTGFEYFATSDQEVIKASANATIPPCPELIDCILHPVSLGADFTGLSGLRIVARVVEKPVIWFMDDVQLAWSNNTCAAGLERSRRR